jgi:5-methylcytosine-specific restriction enzyme A
MASRALRFCLHPGCGVLTDKKYCDAHAGEDDAKRAEQDKRRGNANQRGYTYRWSKYSKWFLSQPGNQICKLHIDEGCTLVADCVDHIQPVCGRDDPNFFRRENHQASCTHCNSVKGHKFLRGEYVLGGEGGGAPV